MGLELIDSTFFNLYSWIFKIILATRQNTCKFYTKGNKHIHKHSGDDFRQKVHSRFAKN